MGGDEYGKLDPAVAQRLEVALRNQMSTPSTLPARASKMSRLEVAYLHTPRLPPVDAIASLEKLPVPPDLPRPFESTFLAQYVEQSEKRRKKRAQSERRARAGTTSRETLSPRAIQTAAAWAVPTMVPTDR